MTLGIFIETTVHEKYKKQCKEDGFKMGKLTEKILKNYMSGDLLDISDLPRKEKDMIKKIVIGAKFN